MKFDRFFFLHKSKQSKFIQNNILDTTKYFNEKAETSIRCGHHSKTMSYLIGLSLNKLHLQVRKERR